MIAKTLITNALKDLGIRILDLDSSGALGSDIVAAAFRKIGIKAAETPLTTNELSDGLDTVNDMLAEWRYDGIDLGVTSIDANATSLPTWSLSAVKSSLGARLATEYAVPISDSLALTATDSYSKLSERTSPVLMNDGLEVLSGLCLELDAKGDRLGYLNPQDITEETGLPDWSIPYIKTSLAIRMASLTEKQPSPALMAVNRDSKKNFYSKMARTPVASLPSTLPIGSGNEKYTYQTHHYDDSPDLLGTDVDAFDTGDNVDISLTEDYSHVEQ